MVKAAQPELKKYMEKRISCQLNGKRKVVGILRGFDPFMNVVLEDTIEEVSPTEKHKIGTVVLRGNSILMVEALEKVSN